MFINNANPDIASLILPQFILNCLDKGSNMTHFFEKHYLEKSGTTTNFLPHLALTKGQTGTPQSTLGSTHIRYNEIIYRMELTLHFIRIVTNYHN